jgi:hypothetical protein
MDTNVEMEVKADTVEMWFRVPDRIWLAEPFRVWANYGAMQKTFPQCRHAHAWRRGAFVKVRFNVAEGHGEEIVKRIASHWPFLRVYSVKVCRTGMLA